MNRKQLAALWAGIVLAGAFLLYPPHVMLPSTVQLLAAQVGIPDAKPPQFTRYAFLFSPPAGSVGIDWERLAVPLAFVGLLTFGAIVSLKSRPHALPGEGRTA